MFRSDVLVSNEALELPHDTYLGMYVKWTSNGDFHVPCNLNEIPHTT